MLTAAHLAHDTGAAIKFLHDFAPTGPWVLTAIPLEGKTTTATFGPEKEEACSAWIDQFQGVQNLYFMVNKPIKPLNNKASKSDVKEMGWLHVDVDPRPGEDFEEERKRAYHSLVKFNPPPTFIIDSGGGFQGFWKLEEPEPVNGDVKKCEALETYNHQIELVLGGDHCFNLDRIMRLPGTINVPNAKKQKKGRVKSLAKVITFAPENVYPLKRFSPAPKVQTEEVSGGLGGDSATSVKISGNLPRIEDVSKLPVSDRVKMLIVQGCDPDEPNKWASRSELLFHVLCEMVRAGMEDDIIASVIMDPDFKISESVLDKPRSEKYAARQIGRAKREVGSASDFIRDDKGAIRRNLASNIAIGLNRLHVKLSYDEFARRELIQIDEAGTECLSDGHVNTIWYRFDKMFGTTEGFSPAEQTIDRVIRAMSRENSFHPLQDYLEELVWDQRPRIDTWLIDYGGANDTSFVRAVGRIVLVAAVKRVFEPGCKFDEMLILEGPQGCRKSSAVRALAAQDQWFTDGLRLNMESQELVETISGRWIVEAPELAGLTGKGVDHLKKLLSQQEDVTRMAYDRRVTTAKRQCIFIGTTNSNQYLLDSENRRFWPVKVKGFDLDALTRDRNQLWAEAMAAARNNVSTQLDQAFWQEARAEQEARREIDPWEEHLDKRIGTKTGKVKSREIFDALNLPIDRRTQKDNARVGKIMRKLGFARSKARFKDNKGAENCYVRGDEENKLEISLAISSDDFRTGNY